MIQPSRRPGFLEEAAFAAGIGNLPRTQDLQGDDAIQAGITRLIDLAHSSGAQKFQDLVRTERTPAGKAMRIRFYPMICPRRCFLPSVFRP